MSSCRHPLHYAFGAALSCEHLTVNSMLQGKNTPLSDVAKQFSEMRAAGFRIHPWP